MQTFVPYGRLFRANGRMWMTKDVIREASERTGIPIRVVRGNLDNAHDYYI